MASKRTFCERLGGFVDEDDPILSGAKAADPITEAIERQRKLADAYSLVLADTERLKAARASFAKPGDLDGVLRYLRNKLESTSHFGD